MDNLKYSKDHVWVKIEGDVATIGISDFAQKQLKDIVFVELPEAGKHVTQFKEAAIAESVKSVSDIFAPVSGEVIEVNKELIDKPELLNEDPYGSGWVLKIKMENSSELNSLMPAKDYEELVKE